MKMSKGDQMRHDMLQLEIIRNWKDGEFAYCEALVRTRGSKGVPQQSVESYLNLQCASAARDGRLDVVQAFNRLIQEWTRHE